MLFGNTTSRSPYDWNFALFDIPVRVHPLFWLTSLLLGLGNPEPTQVLIWVCVCFVSILIHELGHALTMRYYGWRPSITLHGFGGYASYGELPYHSSGRRAQHPVGAHILITAAGPLAGFLFAGVVISGLYIAGRSLPFPFLDEPIGRGQPVMDPVWFSILTDLLYVNVFWGIVNLFPVWPLDGGQIARYMLMASNPVDGYGQSLTLSLFAGVLLAVAAVVRFEQPYMAMMFGLLAYDSFQLLQQRRS